jgi:pSer/pThr/pTyr-binding forkhead associated (FHA) protein
LEVNNEKQKKFKHIVDHKSITIGRDEDCNLKILDGHVSGQQCQVVYRHGHFTVIDLGSLNKTRVNDKVYVQKNLTDGDVISIGKTKITFHGPEDVE